MVGTGRAAVLASGHRGGPGGRLADMPTTVDGFGTAEPLEMLDRYRQRSDRDLSSLDWYVALQFWRVACIIEGGARVRHTSGAMLATAL